MKHTRNELEALLYNVFFSKCNMVKSSYFQKPLICNAQIQGARFLVPKINITT